MYFFPLEKKKEMFFRCGKGNSTLHTTLHYTLLRAHGLCLGNTVLLRQGGKDIPSSWTSGLFITSVSQSVSLLEEELVVWLQELGPNVLSSLWLPIRNCMLLYCTAWETLSSTHASMTHRKGKQCSWESVHSRENGIYTSHGTCCVKHLLKGGFGSGLGNARCDHHNIWTSAFSTTSASQWVHN